MHLENILNTANPASQDAFVKEHLYFATAADRNIATIIDNHNKDFTIALVTAIRQLLAIANVENTKREKKLKNVLDKYTLDNGSSKESKPSSSKSPSMSNSTYPIGNQSIIVTTPGTAALGNTTSNKSEDRQPRTNGSEVIYPKPILETNVNNSFPHPIRETTSELPNAEINNASTTITTLATIPRSTKVAKKILYKPSLTPMDIDFTPPAHPPNNVINNITPQNSEQYSQPMIIDHSSISTSHSSPRDLIEQPATAINQPVVHQHSSPEQIQIAVDDSL